MNAIYLYSNVMPYTIEGLTSLIEISKLNIHLIHYPVTINAPYQLPNVSKIWYYEETKMSYTVVAKMLVSLKPRFIFITGWSNKKYLRIARKALELGIPVISGCDTQWRCDIRQIVAVLFSKLLVRKYADYMMVPGVWQYEYARLLGFKRDKILTPLYASNLTTFNKAFHEFIMQKKIEYPKNILFVGRFEKIKGIDLLVKAFKSIEHKNGWKITLIGNGTQKESVYKMINGDKNFQIKEFLQPNILVNEIKDAGAFCLPSIYEPWGVVIQEFAAGGLPIVASNTCGATQTFVKDYYNGFLFETGNIEDLRKKLTTLISMSVEDLILYSYRSNMLSHSIRPYMYAANFLKFI